LNLQFIPGQVRINSPLVKLIKTAQTRVKFKITGEKCVNLNFRGEPTCQIEKNKQIHASSCIFAAANTKAPPDSSSSKFLGTRELSSLPFQQVSL